MQSIPSLPLFPDPLCPRVVAPDWVLSMGQIELKCVLMINWIVWSRTVFDIETVHMLNWIVWNGTVLCLKKNLASISYNGWCVAKPNLDYLHWMGWIICLIIKDKGSSCRSSLPVRYILNKMLGCLVGFYTNNQFYFKQFSLAWVHSLLKTFLFQAIQFSQTVLIQMNPFSISIVFIHTQ